MSRTGSKKGRRAFLKTLGAGGAALAAMQAADRAEAANSESRSDPPNFLWITCEDISPALGCYGDAQARTPNLDRLAARGLLFENAFATAPVCSPSRSCLITGVYATSLGTQHLRSSVKLPDEIRCFTEYFRRAGYYCTNNYKQDYNFAAPEAWDESGKLAQWRHRAPGQPFFAVFNSITTHQSQIDGPDPRFFAQYSGNLSREERHDPAAMVVPPFYPDTPVVREIFARYYDLITLMDKEAAHLLEMLEQDGLADNTIVFFFSDHGLGLPRYKRTLYDTGLNVPLIVHIPERWKHLAPRPAGSRIERLVSFVDFAPTMLSLAGLPIPNYMQGRAFLGGKAGRERDYVFGASSRVDESYEKSRSVRDLRFKYIRNYFPHLPYSQTSAWPDQAIIAGELRRVAREGELTPAQQWITAKSKPIEELYDTEADPHELKNLADSPAHRETLERLRAAHLEWEFATRDAGFLPEAEMHIRAEGSTIYDVAQDPDKYPLERIVDTADKVGRGAGEMDVLVDRLGDPDSAVRYWAATGLLAMDKEAKPAAKSLEAALDDPAPNVRFAAAQALCAIGRNRKAVEVLADGLDDPRPTVVLRAARSLQLIGRRARPVVPQMEAALEHGGGGVYEMFIRWALGGALHNCGRGE